MFGLVLTILAYPWKKKTIFNGRTLGVGFGETRSAVALSEEHGTKCKNIIAFRW